MIIVRTFDYYYMWIFVDPLVAPEGSSFKPEFTIYGVLDRNGRGKGKALEVHYTTKPVCPSLIGPNKCVDNKIVGGKAYKVKAGFLVEKFYPLVSMQHIFSQI